jgi:hypothetical protein
MVNEKKDFTSQLGNLLADKTKTKKVGRPKTNFKEIEKTSQDGTKAGETRATFIVREDLLDKIKGLAYWECIQIKDVVNKFLEEGIRAYEEKNGEVKPKKQGGQW